MRCVPMASMVVLLLLLAIPPVLAADGPTDGPAVAADIHQLMQARDYAAAVAALDEAVKQEGVSKDELAYLKGRALALAKRYDEAATVLLAIGQQSPESPWARKGRFAAAAALVAKGDFARAQPIYRAEAESLLSLQRKQEVAGIYLEFADALFTPPRESDEPDYAQAQELYQKALDLGLLPEKRLEVELRIARCLLEQGGPALLEGACAAYAAFLDDHPESVHDLEARFRLGECLLARKEHAQARQAWRELVARHAEADSPRIAEAAFRLAETWRIPRPESVRDLVQGVAILREFVKRYPDHELAAKAHLHIAQSYVHRKKHAEAIEALTPFLADPRYEAAEEIAGARNLLGQAYREQKKYDDALAAWQAFLVKHPADPAWSTVQKSIVNMEYARAYEAYQAERYDEAIERWNEFLARYPLDDRSARVLFLLAAIDAQQERWEAAVAAWHRLASKHPDSAEARQARLSVAVTLEEKLGRMDEALEEYRKLAELQSYELEVEQAQGAIVRMTSPSLTLTTRRVFRGNEKPSVRLSTRNIKSVSVRVYRVDLEAYFRKMHATDGIDTLDVGLIAPDATFLYEVPEYAKYRRFDNDVELPLLEGQTAGVLAVTVSSKTQEATTLVLQSDLDIIVKSSREGLFVFAQNMATGKPWPEARLLLSDGTKVWGEATTDQQGVFQGTFDELKTAEHLQILATAGVHMAASGLEIENVQAPPAPSDLGYLATDRSVYRPGDEVCVRGVPRHVKDGAFLFEPGAAYSLEVYDRNDRRLWHESLAISPLGVFHARVPLPALCAAGEYLLKVEDAQGRQFSRHFTVEPLERKPIRLEVNLPRGTFYRGEPIEGTFRAMTSYGVPLVGSKITYRLADEIEQTATTDHRGEIRFRLKTDEFVESQPLVLSANLAEGGAQTEVTLFLSVEDFGLTLQTTRPVYMAAETFQVDVLAHDANEQPVGRKFALSVLKRDAKTSDETLIERHELESDAAGKASQPLKLEAGGDYVLRAEAVDRFGNAILAEHGVWISDAGDDVRLRILADTDETTAGGTLAATVLWHEAPALALVTCEGDTVLDYRLVPLETGANRIEIPVGLNLLPNFRLAVAVMTGGGAPSPDKKVEDHFFMADAPFEVRRELVVDLAIARADGTTSAERIYQPGESLEVTVTTTDAAGRPLPAEVGLALVDAWFRPLGDSALTRPQDVLRPARRALAMQTVASIEFQYEPGTRPIGTWPADEGDDSESEEEEAPREFAHWAGNRGQSPKSLEALLTPVPASSRPQPGGGGVFQFGFGPNHDDPFAKELDSSTASLPKEERAKPVRFFRAEILRLSTADVEFADTGYWNPTVRTGEDGKATVTVVLPLRHALWQLVAEAVAADTLTGLAERSITAETDLAVELRLPESFTEGDRATIPVVVYNRAIAEGSIALTLKTTILGQTVEEKQTLPVKEKGRLDARLPVTITLPVGTAAAPPWFEALFELTVTAGQQTSVVRRGIPVFPLGVPMHGTAGGMATGSKAIRASHPADAVAARRSMQLLVSPTLERALLDIVLQPAESAASLRPFSTPASPLETTADELMAAAALRSLVTPENSPADAQVLDRHMQTVMGQLVASQQDTGNWTWTGQRGDADLLATARAAWALSLAKQAGCLAPEPALAAALD
ncbi:MAG: tetratricopeptide repeat protein, partial [Patescibacteria group bacterium]|nr:tetratricopeptide repeat protein [Patescibacteria group bacterium]